MNRRSSKVLPLFQVAIVLVVIVLYLGYRVRVPQRSPRYPSATRSVPPEQPLNRESGLGNQLENLDRYNKQSPSGDASCLTLGVACASTYFSEWQEPANGACEPAIRNGYPVPDPRCTPGGINPTVTAQVLTNPDWRTRCTRNCESSESEKHVTYRWYAMTPPHGNSGSNQVCELDHLVPLELGGADGLGNIWPECGPDGVTLENRYFKVKDRVENYLAGEVRAGRMSLNDAQRGIASDWTQYLLEVNR